MLDLGHICLAGTMSCNFCFMGVCVGVEGVGTSGSSCGGWQPCRSASGPSEDGWQASRVRLLVALALSCLLSGLGCIQCVNDNRGGRGFVFRCHLSWPQARVTRTISGIEEVACFELDFLGNSSSL